MFGVNISIYYNTNTSLFHCILGIPVWIIIVSAIVGFLLFAGVIVAVICIIKRCSLKGNPERLNIVRNPSQPEAKAGCSSHVHGTPQCKDEVLKGGVYYKIGESKLDVSQNHPAEDKPYIGITLRSRDLPPPPDRVHYTPTLLAQTLNALEQGMYNSSISVDIIHCFYLSAICLPASLSLCMPDHQSVCHLCVTLTPTSDNAKMFNFSG